MYLIFVGNTSGVYKIMAANAADIPNFPTKLKNTIRGPRSVSVSGSK